MGANRSRRSKTYNSTILKHKIEYHRLILEAERNIKKNRRNNDPVIRRCQLHCGTRDFINKLASLVLSNLVKLKYDHENNRKNNLRFLTNMYENIWINYTNLWLINWYFNPYDDIIHVVKYLESHPEILNYINIHFRIIEHPEYNYRGNWWWKHLT